MVDYSKWDKLELSDDSDIEVHPNVDKKLFIRAKQTQIHAERHNKKLQIEALKYERQVNETIAERLSKLISILQSQSAAEPDQTAGELAFRAIMELSVLYKDNDILPTPPDGVVSDKQTCTYSGIVTGILDEVNWKLDTEDIPQETRYNGLIKELESHLQKIQSLQSSVDNRLKGLQDESTTRITSESYRTGFDSSHLNKSIPGAKAAGSAELQLLNPDFDVSTATDNKDSSDTTDLSFDNRRRPRASAAAMEFANIRPSSLKESHAYISAHPEILRESEIDGLLITAFDAAVDNNDTVIARQYIHQAVLIQYCRLLGRDGVSIFFKRISTPGHQSRDIFERDVSERFQRISELAKKQIEESRSKKGAEQIQIQAIDPGTEITFQVPPANSEDEEVQRARAVFDTFPPEMKKVLEGGSIEQVNDVLAAMDVIMAEKIVAELGNSGCLNIDGDVIDATTEEGRKMLRDVQDSATTGTDEPE